MVPMSTKFSNHYRLTLFACELIDAVAAKMGMNCTSVVEIAVRQYAKEVLGPRRFNELERITIEHKEELLNDRYMARQK